MRLFVHLDPPFERGGKIARMPNIATALKTEISRIARKEIRTELAALQKASSQQRHHIAALRREIEALEKSLKKVTRGAQTAVSGNDKAGEGTELVFASGREGWRAIVNVSACRPPILAAYLG